ncbi:MAG: T9SS type A sorting domain-containing protein [Bacteroidetes bacterium]|nr:T9SS type A sorting domain-containing protein [Bacteroidota bacterium]
MHVSSWMEGDSGVVPGGPGSGFEVFPNPSSGILYIRRAKAGAAVEAAIELLGINGQVVQRKEMGGGEWMTSMDTKGLAPGAYVVRIEAQDGQVSNHKILLQ